MHAIPATRMKGKLQSAVKRPGGRPLSSIAIRFVEHPMIIEIEREGWRKPTKNSGRISVDPVLLQDQASKSYLEACALIRAHLMHLGLFPRTHVHPITVLWYDGQEAHISQNHMWDMHLMTGDEHDWPTVTGLQAKTVVSKEEALMAYDQDPHAHFFGFDGGVQDWWSTERKHPTVLVGVESSDSERNMAAVSVLEPFPSYMLTKVCKWILVDSGAGLDLICKAIAHMHNMAESLRLESLM